MMQLALDPQESRRRKREGVALVAANNSPWIDLMLVQLWAFAWVRHEFTFELFRAWATLNRFPEPTNHHAWGALTQAAKAAEFIEWTGRYIDASSVKTHNHPIKVWTGRKVAYG
jgi:hypothetical protein